MTLQPSSLEFIQELERSSNQKLFFPTDVGCLLEAARRLQKMEAFDEAIFLAKFITKSAGIMRRIGPDGDGYDTLSLEVQAGIQKASSLLQSISQGCQDDLSHLQSAMFFAVSHEALERLMKLFADLTLVKNWVLDKKPLP